MLVHFYKATVAREPGAVTVYLGCPSLSSTSVTDLSPMKTFTPFHTGADEKSPMYMPAALNSLPLLSWMSSPGRGTAAYSIALQPHGTGTCSLHL